MGSLRAQLRVEGRHYSINRKLQLATSLETSKGNGSNESAGTLTSYLGLSSIRTKGLGPPLAGLPPRHFRIGLKHLPFILLGLALQPASRASFETARKNRLL